MCASRGGGPRQTLLSPVAAPLYVGGARRVKHADNQHNTTTTPKHLTTGPHPLDQLSPDEVRRAAACTRAYAAAPSPNGGGLAGAPLRFNTVMLHEPPKRALLDFYHGRAPAPPRRALVWVLSPSSGALYEGVVDLPAPGGAGSPGGGGGGGACARGAADRMVAWRQIDGAQPTATPCDGRLAEEIILADAGVMAMVAERYGITDARLLVFDAWTLHGSAGLPAGLEGRRLMQAFLYVRLTPEDNE